MARRKRKFTMCPKNKFRFLTPSLCSVCEHLEKCNTFREYYKKNKKKYIEFVYETVEKFPEKYQLEVVFMSARLKFIQIVDKKTGKIEEVIESKTLEALSIEDKIALSRGKELYVVTHVIEPVVKVNMRQKRIVEPVNYLQPDDVISIDAEKEVEEKKKASPKTVKKSTAKQTEKPKTKAAPKKKAPSKKKTD